MKQKLRVPLELLERLKRAKESVTSEYGAATSFNDERLSYEYYLEKLRAYCTELELPEVGTHGLRHSTSELYIHHGATLCSQNGCTVFYRNGEVVKNTKKLKHYPLVEWSSHSLLIPVDPGHFRYR